VHQNQWQDCGRILFLSLILILLLLLQQLPVGARLVSPLDLAACFKASDRLNPSSITR
jgi:hypothetical protein